MSTQFPFSKRRLAAIVPPATGRDQYRDTKVAGLTLRVTPNGTMTFTLYKKVGARPLRYSLGRFPSVTVEQARHRAADVLGKLGRGDDPAAARQQGRQEATLADLFRYWVDSYAREHKKTYREDERLFRKFLKPLASRQLSSVRSAEIQRLHAKVGAESGKYQANRLLELVRAMFNRAEGIGYKGENPTLAVKPYREQSRDRFLQADELTRFFQALNEEPNKVLRDFFFLALLTGARRGNLQAMRWDDVNLEACVWRIPETKAGVPVLVPLVEAAVKILQGRLEASNGSPWVFPSPKSRTGHVMEPKTAWKRILVNAGLQDVRVHDLRRTLGSWQVATGASLPVVGKMLGHTQPRTTAIYGRLELTPVRQAAEAATVAMFQAGGLLEGPKHTEDPDGDR